MCKEYIHDPDNNCKNLIYPASVIVKVIQKKKNLVLDSIGYTVSKRSTMLGMVTKAARLIYGMCNLECIKQFNFNIGQTHNAPQIKLIKEQIKIVKLKSEFNEHEYYNMSFVINE